MKHKLTVREKWMLAALPAVLTALGYYALSVRPSSDVREKLRRQAQAQGPLVNHLAQVRRAQEDYAALAKAVAAQTRPETLPAMIFDRNRALQLASQLCENHQLMLISSAVDPAAKLPAALQEGAAAVTKPAGSTAPQIWRIELRGPYLGLLDMLEELRGQGPLMVPLSVAMQPGADERKPPSWVLSVWL